MSERKSSEQTSDKEQPSPQTKAQYLAAVVKELSLDTSDPFTRVMAAAFALQDAYDNMRVQNIGLIRELGELKAENNALNDAKTQSATLPTIRRMEQCPRHQGLPTTLTVTAYTVAATYCPNCEDEEKRRVTGEVHGA